MLINPEIDHITKIDPEETVQDNPLTPSPSPHRGEGKLWRRSMSDYGVEEFFERLPFENLHLQIHPVER